MKLLQMTSKSFSAVAFICACLISCSACENNCLNIGEENKSLKFRIDSLQKTNAEMQIKLRVYELKASKKSKSKVLVNKRKSRPMPQYQSSAHSQKGSIYSSSSQKSSSKSGSYSSQCSAITKKGYRCSRKSRSGGYCWQHGG